MMTGLSKVLVPPDVRVEEISLKEAQSLFCLARTLDHGATLDSSPGFGWRGRFSYACADPFLILTSRGSDVRLTRRGGEKIRFDNPFRALRSVLSLYESPDIPLPTPFAAGAAGFLSYDLGRSVERLGPGPLDETSVPDMCLAFYDHIVAIDHSAGRAWTYSTDFSGRELYTPSTIDSWHALTTDIPRPEHTLHPDPTIESSLTRTAYIRAIRTAKEYIAAGDIYQVNLSQRFKSLHTVSPQVLYRRLLGVNPAPYACFLNFGDYIVASASPEEFLTYDAATRHVRTSPIKGTRPRGKTPEDDERLKAELFRSEKDRAENIMIVDLERNDLGRVCSYGSIAVTDMYGVETHPTVHHLVSVVEGTLHDRYEVVDLLKAAFPGGSITGAPKLRSMQIIDELEPVRRGIYTGSAGYFDFRGNMSLNILIRSFLIHRGEAYFHAGGGIVADSDPEAEYQESLDKVKGLMEALGDG